MKLIFKLIFMILVFFSMFIFLFGKKTDMTQTPIKADLIVCLGGGYIERLNKGIELYKENFADNFMFTGPAIGLFDYKDKIGFWKIPFFIEKGVHEKDIVFLEHIKNTYEEIKEIKAYMLKHGYQTVLIVSDPPHSKRIQYLINIFKYKNSHLDAKVIGADVKWWNEKKYIDSFRAFWEALKEIIAMEYYKLRYR